MVEETNTVDFSKIENQDTVVSNNASANFSPDLIASNEFGPPTLANLADQYGTEIDLEDQRALFRKSIDVKSLIREGFTEEQIAKYLVEKFPVPRGQQLSYEKVFYGNQKDNNKVIQLIMDEPETSYAEQLGVAINKGAMEVGVPAIAAVTAGVKTGLAAGAMSGPFALPVSISVGLGVGATTFYSLSKLGLQTSELILPESEYVSSQPQYFPLQEAGEMGGANLFFGSAPWQLSKYLLNPGKVTYGNLIAKNQRVSQGSKEVISPFEQMALSARDSPFKTAFFEASTIGGVSVGSFIAEETDPGNYPLKLGLELLYGVLAPTATAVTGNLALQPINLVKRMFNLYKSGKAVEFLNIKQGQWFRDNIENSGSDFKTVMKKLSDPELTKLLNEGRKTLDVKPTSLGPTVAGLTGDPFMIALESTLAKQSPSFRQEAAASYKEGMTGLHNLIKLMEQSGDTKLVEEAANMKAQVFKALIERRLLTAQENAEASVNKIIGPENQKRMDDIITNSNPDSSNPNVILPEQSNLGKLNAKAGVVTNEITENAIRDVREQESKFYDLVDGQEPIVPNSFIETVASILREEGEDAAQFIPTNVLNLYYRAIGKDADVVSKETANISLLKEKILKQETKINDFEVVNQDTAKLINDFDNTLNRSDLTDESILAAYQAEKARIEGLSTSNENIKLNKNLLEARERIKTTPNSLQRKEGEYDFFFPYTDAKTRITNTSDKAWSELSLSQKLDAFNLEKQGFNKRYYDELADLEARVNSGARSGVEAEQLGTGTMAQAILRLQTHKKEGLNDLNKNLQRVDDEMLLLENEGFNFLSSPQKKRAINLLNQNIVVLNDRLKLKALNAAVTQEVDLGQEATEVLLKDLINLRSNLLSKVRSAQSSEKWQPAHFMSDIAEGIRQDFETFTAVDPSGQTSFNFSSANKDALRNAWTFSKEFNDTFSRAAPVAKTVRRNSKGGLAIMPELLFKDLTSGGGDATTLKFQKMQKAMTFLSEKLGKDFEATDFARLGTMKAGQETMLAYLFEKVVDPQTNLVDPAALAKFKRENRNVLDLFPLVQKDMESIETANAALKTRKDEFDLGTTALEKRKVKGVDSLSNFANETNLNSLISEILGDPGARGTNPDKVLKDYAKRIKEASKNKKYTGIEDGFFSTILDRAMTFSTTPGSKGTDPYFNPQSFKRYLIDPLIKNRPSALDILKREGIITNGQQIRLRTIVDDMIKFEKQEKNLLSQDIPVVEKGFLGETGRMLRVGATVASVGTYNWMRGLLGLQSTGAGGIAVPASIASAAQEYVKIPANMTLDVIERAVLDPEFFKLITSKTKSQKEILRFRLKFGNAMYKGGSLRTLTEEQRLEEERRIKQQLLKLEQDRINKMLIEKQGYDIEELKKRARPSQKDLRTSFLQRPKGPASGPGQSGGSPPTTNSADRARFAALFPEDRDLIGIGSLMS